MLRPDAGTGGIIGWSSGSSRIVMLKARPIRTIAGAADFPEPRQQRHRRPDPGQHQRKSRRPIHQSGQCRIHDPPMATILSKTRCEKLDSVVAMNGPSIARARPIATIFGRNANVASLIWVTA